MQWDAKTGQWRYPGARPNTPIRRPKPDPVVERKPTPPKLEPPRRPPKAKKDKAAIASSRPAAPTAAVVASAPMAGATPGQLVVSIRIDGYPKDVRTTPNGWKQFDVDCGAGWVFTVTLRPRMFAQFEEAAAWPEWGAVIGGKMGARTKIGYALDLPTLKVFEKKAREEAGATPGAPQARSESVSPAPAPPEPSAPKPAP